MLGSFKNKLIAVSFIGVLAFVVFVLLPKQQTEAVGMLPFGGTIGSTIYCTCNDNMLLTIIGPIPATLVYQPGVSNLFSFGQIYRPKPSILGTYAAGGVCLMYAVVGCIPIPSTGTIAIAGTSL